MISQSIVYGTISTWLGKKAEGEHTHEWVCYVRGLHDEDLSFLIDRVVFTLHSSFMEPNREVSTHPFVIHERGWGQFEIRIRVYLKGSYDSPLEVNHMLKLYSTNNQNTPMSKKPVVHECQDEIVFVNPSPQIIGLFERLKECREQDREQSPLGYQDLENPSEEPINAAQFFKNMRSYFQQFDVEENIKKLNNALQYLNQELIVEQSKKLRNQDEEIQNLEAELHQLQTQIVHHSQSVHHSQTG